MKSSLLKLSGSFLTVFVIACLLSCQIGLGSAVDTQPPVISITEPTDSFIVRDNFTIKGNLSDDRGVSEIEVSLTNTNDPLLVYNNFSAAFSNEEGNWSCDIKAVEKDSSGKVTEHLITDGTYTITVTAFDTYKHSTVTSRTITIDNTPPVLIVTSPTTIDIDSNTSYGQVFDFVASAADDNDITRLEILFYDENGDFIEKDGQEGIAVFEDVSRQIDVTAATWQDDIYNLIYGINKEAGTKAYYIGVKAYDDARKLSLEDGEEDFGNESSEFYLSDTFNYKASEAYRVLSGQTSSMQEAKVEEITAALDSQKEGRVTISLNPVNNPTFEVQNYEPFVAGTSSFEFDEYRFTTGSTINITIKQGLDNKKIKSDTVGVYLYECNANGQIINVDSNGKAIPSVTVLQPYCDENGEVYTDASGNALITKAEHDKGIKINKDSVSFSCSLKSQNEGGLEGLELNKYYIVDVLAYDYNNVICHNTDTYAFKFITTASAPVVEIAEPGTSKSIASSAAFTVSGKIKTAQSPSVIKVRAYIDSNSYEDEDDAGDYFASSVASEILANASNAKFAEVSLDTQIASGHTELNGKTYSIPYSFTVPEGLDASTNFNVIIVAVDDNNEVGTNKIEVTNDTQAPVFGEFTLSPYVGDGISSAKVNGIVSIKQSVDDNNIVSNTWYSLDEGETWIEIGQTSAMNFEVDTTLYDDEQGKGKKVVYLKAQDKAGNITINPSKADKSDAILVLDIDQSTDTPVVELTNSDSSITEAEEIASTQKNIFGLTSNNQLLGTISDDDKISQITIMYAEGEEWPADSGSGTIKTLLNISPDLATYNLKTKLPEHEGSYLIKIIVKDSKNDEENTGCGTNVIGPYLVAVDNGAPVLEITSAGGKSVYKAKGGNVSVSGNLNDKTALLKRYTNAACTENESDVALGTYDSSEGMYFWTDTIIAGSEAETKTYYYKATDRYGQYVIASYTFSVDPDAPVFLITNVEGDTSETQTSLNKDSEQIVRYGKTTGYFTLKGSVSDDTGTSGTSSGLTSYLYYKVLKEGTNPEKNTSGTAYVIDDWNTAPISYTDSGYVWEAPISLASFAEGDTCYIYFAAKDKADNVSLIAENPSNKIKIQIDGTKPLIKDISLNITSENTEIVLIAKDAESGIDLRELKLAGSLYQPEAAGALTQTSQEIEEGVNAGYSKFTFTIKNSLAELMSGANIFTVTVTDKAGNSALSPELVINNNAPVISGLAITNANSRNKDGEYVLENQAFDISGSVKINENDGSNLTGILEWQDITEDESILNSAEVEIAADGSFTCQVDPASTALSSASGTLTKAYKDYENLAVTRVYTAKNVYGRSSQASVKFKTDITAPKFNLADVNETILGLRINGNLTTSDKWNDSTTLPVKGSVLDNGSGVEKISYTINTTEGEFYTSQASAGGKKYYTFSGTSSAFVEGDENTITLTASDKAGNTVVLDTIPDVKVDLTAPVTSDLKYRYEDEDAADEKAYENAILTNKEKAVILSGKFKDEKAGVKTSGISDEEGSILVLVNNKEFAADITYDSENTSGSWSARVDTSELGSDGSYQAYVKITDQAGNSDSSTSCYFKVDTVCPAVKIESPGNAVSLNGNNTFSGKLIEANNPKSVELYYIFSKTEKTAAQLKALSSWQHKEDASLKKVVGENDVTISDVSSWKFEDINVNDFLGSETSGNLYILPLAYDEAGNCNIDTDAIVEKTSSGEGYTKFYVDLDSDRPVIKFSNLAKASAYLKYTSTLTGSINDDDGISLFEVKIGDEDFEEVPVNSGAFSINLGDDGEKVLEFRITDSAGGVFVTGGNISASRQGQIYQPKLIYTDSAAGTTEDNELAVSFVTDSTAPVMENPQYAVFASEPDAEEIAAADYTDLVTSNVAGGEVKRYLVFKVAASDNGSSVKEVSASAKVGLEEKSVSFTKAGSSDIYYSQVIDLSVANGFSSGTYSFTFTVTDKAEIKSETSKNITVDNSAPSAKLISPANNDLVTGEITLIGSAMDDSDVELVKYLIGNNTITNAEAALTEVKKATCICENAGSETAWQFELNGSANEKLPASAQSLEAYSDYKVEGKSIYQLPLYIYTKDKLGNEGIKEESIMFNPYGDRPTASVSYPLGSFDDEKEELSNVSGSIRVTGAAEDNVSMTSGAVYIQLDVNNDGQITSADKLLLEAMLEADDSTPVYTIIEDITTVSGQEGITDVSDSSAIDGEEVWGIRANGSNSWNFTMNTANELQNSNTSIAEGTYKIGFRAVAMDGTGVYGEWSEISYFVIDVNAPSFVSSSVKTDPDDEDEIAQAYESDMFLSGTKYLIVEIKDEIGLKNVKYTYTTSLDLINSAENSGEITKAELDAVMSGSGPYTYKVRIPVSELADSSHLNSNDLALKVVATKNSDTETTSYERYQLHFDNTAPEIDKLALNGITYEDSDKKIVNSNGYFTIGGQASDDGAGFERMSFYFMRNAGTTITESRIYDLMIAPDEGIDSSVDQPNYISIAGTDEITINLGSELNPDNYSIYGKYQNNLLVEDGGAALSGYTEDSHVHEGGYLQIGSSWHKISSISGSRIELANPTTASGRVKVFFAYLNSIDNTGTEKSDGLGGVSSGDDGDTMPESIIKSQTTWNYDASFFSNYIPDGPGILVTFVYDKAGNLSAKKYDVSVQNKAPRLTKLWLSTDLNSSDTFADDAESGLTEIIEYNVLGKTGEQTNYKDMKTADYKGERFIIKNKLAVIPEFTNGNRQIYMALNNAAEDDLDPTAFETEEEALAALYTSQAAAVPDLADFTLARTGDSKWAYVIDNDSVGQASYVAATGSEKDRAMSFTFWDSTEDTISGVNSNWCYLRISDLVVNVTDQKKPNVVVKPFFWNSADDNSLYQNSYENGHIELEESTEEDAAVSGKISIRGTAFDDHTLASIWVKYDGFTPAAGLYNGSADSDGYYKVAAYVMQTDEEGNESGKAWVSYAEPDSVDGNKWKFTVTPDYLGQTGHKVNWQLDIDTSAIEGAMGENKKVYLRAIDETAHSSSEDASDEANGTSDDVYNAPSYTMDVLPYISGISTDAAGNNPAKRSRLGRYPVRAGDTIYIKGFNFGTEDDTISVIRTKSAADGSLGLPGGVISNASWVDANTISITAPDYSGFIQLQIDNGDENLKAVNNSNDNTLGYNIEEGFIADEKDEDENTYGRIAANTAGSNFWTDDRYLSVWNSGETFTNASNPISGSIIGLTASSSVYTSAREARTFPAHTLYGIWGSNDNMMYNEVMGPAGANYNTRWYILSQQASGALRSPPSETDSVIVNNNVFHTWLDDGWADANTFGDGLQLVRDGETASTSASYIEKTSADKVRHQFKNIKIAGAYSGNQYHMYVTYYDSYTKCLKYGKVLFNNDWNQNRSDQGNTRYVADAAGSYVIDGYDAADNSSISWDVGEYSAIKIDNSGAEPIPVVAYYDKQNKQLKIARGGSSAPVSKRYGGAIGTGADASPWIYTTVTSPSGSSDFGRYVSMEMDNSGNLHIAAQDVTNGILYYGLFTLSGDSTYELSGGSWTAVDSTSSVGRWNDIKLENYAGTSMATCKPVITYQDASRLNTTAAVKIAFVDESGSWEAMTSPSLFEAQDSKLSTIVTAIDKDNITNRFAIGFNSTELAVDFLRNE